MNISKGHLYVIPSTLGETAPLEVLPISIKKVMARLHHYVAENEKSARAFIKLMGNPVPQDKIEITVLNKYTKIEDIPALLEPAMEGHPIGLLSEAGMPGVVDPGADIIRLAHNLQIRVVPVTGPSSIILAMAASGLNGQQFAFHGYLPINKHERKKKIKELTKQSGKLNQTQIFIETPYRNMALLNDLIQTCPAHTLLCLATDITLPSEEIYTKTIGEWERDFPDIHKRPTVFLIHQEL